MRSFLSFRFLVFAALLAFILASCNQADNTPEEVAMQWKIYMDNGDFESAKLLSTGSTIEFIEFIQRLMGDLEDYDLDDPDMYEAVSTEQVTCTVSGSKAQCLICCDELGNAEEVDLVLKNRKWLVDLEFDPAIENEMQDFDRMMQELQELFEQSEEEGELLLPEME